MEIGRLEQCLYREILFLRCKIAELCEDWLIMVGARGLGAFRCASIMHHGGCSVSFHTDVLMAVNEHCFDVDRR